MFVWGSEMQTPEPEHGCKIKTDRLFDQQNGYSSGDSHDLSDSQAKNLKSYGRFREKWMFLNLPHCLIFAFSQ